MQRLAMVSAIALSILASASPAAAKDVSERSVCERGEPACVRRVIREMDRRFRKLARRCDHDAIFSLLYLRTTEKFAETLDTIGYAHIQRDLPFVLYDLYVGGHPVSHEDHTLVNDFLAQVDATAEIVDRFDPTFDDNADPAALFRLIVDWRELALTALPPGTDSSTRDAYCAAQMHDDDDDG